MEFLIICIKSLIILALAFLPMLPLLLEYWEFKRDIKNKMSHKRLRLLIFLLIYIIAVTIFLHLQSEFLLWLSSLSFVQWLADKLSVLARAGYCAQVFAVIIINVGIGFAYRILQYFVRPGLKGKDLSTPKKDGEFSLAQKIERKIIFFFYREMYYMVGKIILSFALSLSIAYMLLFVFAQLPAVFKADWIPYYTLQTMITEGNMYPLLTLLGLWGIGWFLEGINQIDKECPDLLGKAAAPVDEEVNLDAVDRACQSEYKDFFAGSPRSGGKGTKRENGVQSRPENAPVPAVHGSASANAPAVSAPAGDSHTFMAASIGQAIEHDTRLPQKGQELYMRCLDLIYTHQDKGFIINGSFFSGFSMYFFRYLSMIAARGDHIAIVCSSDSQLDTMERFVRDGFEKLGSLYGSEGAAADMGFEDTIWQIVKIGDDYNALDRTRINDASILITTLPYLCSREFEENSVSFIHLLDTVVFADMLQTVNLFADQLSALNIRFLNIIENNANKAKSTEKNRGFRIRYKSKRIRYIGFDDSRIPGLDKVLKNLLSVDFESADIMEYNPDAMVRFYRVEPKADDSGEMVFPQLLNTREKLGAVVNMAITAAAAGAKVINIYEGGSVPFGNYSESLAANMGQVSKLYGDVKITVNDHYYDQNRYSVAVVFDENNNLPETMRRYSALLGNEKMLLMIFSRSYLFRDYYIDKIGELWEGTQYTRIPVSEATVKDIARRILVKADSGGITREELLLLCRGVPAFQEATDTEDINSILRTVLKIFGISSQDYVNIYDYFVYSYTRDFDEAGRFCTQDKILLRSSSKYYDIVNGLDVAVLCANGRSYKLPLSKARISQNYIAGQNMIYDGNIYHIDRIKTAEGIIEARLASGGNNDEVVEYIQRRRYIVDFSEDALNVTERTKHIIVSGTDGAASQGAEEQIGVTDIYIAVFSAPLEVVTDGYYEVDPDTMVRNASRTSYVNLAESSGAVLRKQTYRRYGEVIAPEYETDEMSGEAPLNAVSRPASVLSVRLKGSFGKSPDKLLALAGVMLNESLRTMFPSVADCIAVCPVYHDIQQTEADGRGVLELYPQLTIRAGKTAAEDEIEILIIEDCAYDTGLIYALTESGDDILKTLFEPLRDYLEWYRQSVDGSDYLFFGQNQLPPCFDMNALLALSKKVTTGSTKFKTSLLNDKTEYDICDFCRRKLPKPASDIIKGSDGRKMCAQCREHIVGNNKRRLEELVIKAKVFIESTYGIVIDTKESIHFESSVKIENRIKQGEAVHHRGGDLPLMSFIDAKYRIYMEYDIPEINILELIVRELVQYWQLTQAPDADEELAEGHIAFVSLQFLSFAGKSGMYRSMITYYESTKNISGIGYRRLIQLLAASGEYHDNPFMVFMSGDGKKIAPPRRRIAGDGDYGAPYTPAEPDRCAPEELKYVYYERLPEKLQKVYTELVSAVREFRESIPAEGLTEGEKSFVSKAVRYDHPELYYFTTISYSDSTIYPQYGASPEKVKQLDEQLEKASQSFLEGITPEMSAYDALIRLHVRMINHVDYDTIGLNKQHASGGPGTNEIDYLRTVCGALLEGKAVCGGYARAMQYLAQKCGIECAESLGHVLTKSGRQGEYHGWNIVKLDGDYYYLDTTWCDQSNTVQTIKKTDIGFEYFCITTEELVRTRDIDSEPVEMPLCRSTKCNYYVHNGLLIESCDLDKLKEIAVHAATGGKTAVIFKCASRTCYEETMNKLFRSGNDAYELIRAANKVNSNIASDGFTYTYDEDIYVIVIRFKFKNKS